MAQDPYRYFRTEARDILEQLGREVLDLEKGPRAPERVAKLLRLAHTLKGAARVVKQKEIAELAHAMEDALGSLRDPSAEADREAVASLLSTIDAMQGHLARLSPPAEASAAAPPVGAPQPEPLRTLRADVADMDALLEGLGEVATELAALRRHAGRLATLQHLADRLTERGGARPGSRAARETELRAIADELRDGLTSLDRELSRSLEQTGRELGQARELAERLRLLPAGLMFHALERAARDAAATLGRQVTFAARGADVRVDADVLSAVQGALVHVVRNAVAHGVESPPARAAAGKAESGRITVEAARRAGKVAFACRDDGPGIDFAKVAAAARSRGRLPAGAEPSEGEVVRLLLAGGISTSSEVTGVSGRGVGLDVVRETAARLAGEVRVHSERGRGTTLELVVPVSLSSFDALLVEGGGSVCAIPLDAVRATVRVLPGDVHATADGASVVWDGKALPFAPLAEAWAGGTKALGSTRAWSAIVVEGGGAMAAIGVDRLVGTENVVLRPLPEAARARAIIGGASLDVQGNPRPVLDPAALVASVRSPKAREVAPSRAAGAPVLVIDDSLTTRMLEQSILESAGYEVDTATSGEEGLAKALRRRYALFLVDVEMPGMDGFTFVEKTRADISLRSVPAILVTSRAEPEDRLRGEAAGASGYIVKSEFDQNDLLERIRNLVG